MTTDEADAPYLRVPLVPSPDKGLRLPSWVMVDKLTSLPRARLGRRIGRLAADEIGEVERALMVFLGFAD